MVPSQRVAENHPQINFLGSLVFCREGLVLWVFCLFACLGVVVTAFETDRGLRK